MLLDLLRPWLKVSGLSRCALTWLFMSARVLHLVFIHGVLLARTTPFGLRCGLFCLRIVLGHAFTAPPAFLFDGGI